MLLRNSSRAKSTPVKADNYPRLLSSLLVLFSVSLAFIHPRPDQQKTPPLPASLLCPVYPPTSNGKVEAKNAATAAGYEMFTVKIGNSNHNLQGWS
ncbi:hypothetical protein V491_03182 [Pseudogymnoascus sp. VKM F-3775]|nr:hypothetical protein V491_03182 [Pseudogymnoascus sp. VKM F-3775]